MRAPLVKHASAVLLASVFSLATVSRASTQNMVASQATPSGSVSFSFASSPAPVYDLTGSYQFDQQALVAGGTPMDLSLGFSIQQDAAGRLRGAGVTNVQIGKGFHAATYSVNGKIGGGGGKSTHATFSVRWTAQDATAGTDAPFTISVQYNLEVGAGVLNGTARGRAKFAKLSGGSIKSPVSAVPLPAGVDGSWSLTMNIQPPGGTGSISLPSGRSLQASLAGNFSARSGLGRIKLSGVGGDRGNTLNMSYLPATSALGSLSGKVLGQTVVLKSASASITSQTVPQASAPSAFAGSQACLECHTPFQQVLNTTPHGQLGVQCENCHGPASNHAANDYDPVSRPRSVNTFSTNDFFTISTQIPTDFFDPNVNACAQCHNHHGAVWTNSSAPPHNTPQYSILLGNIGELATGSAQYDPAAHALLITNQCVGCHMQPPPNLTSTQAALPGHKFEVNSLNLCLNCHPSPEALLQFVQGTVSNQIQVLNASLNTWATTKAPPALTALYGTRAWEYTTPGELSPGGPGPNAAEQAQIPVNIQKARFNLYLVFYDSSFGVHNGPFTVTLLSTAQDWVNQELSQ